jgi:hypothetical protein
MKPPSGSRPPAAPSPAREEALRRAFAIPEHGLLSELRHMLSAGRMPARTPEDHARNTSFRVVAALLLFLAEFKRRVERGDRLRIVEREQPSKPGRLLVEFTIEVQS